MINIVHSAPRTNICSFNKRWSNSVLKQNFIIHRVFERVTFRFSNPETLRHQVFFFKFFRSMLGHQKDVSGVYGSHTCVIECDNCSPWPVILETTRWGFWPTGTMTGVTFLCKELCRRKSVTKECIFGVWPWRLTILTQCAKVRWKFLWLLYAKTKSWVSYSEFNVV